MPMKRIFLVMLTSVFLVRNAKAEAEPGAWRWLLFLSRVGVGAYAPRLKRGRIL